MKENLSNDKNEEFTSVNDILRSQIKNLVGKKFSTSLSVQTKWKQIVGNVIASHSQVLYVKNDTLFVYVDNSTWHNELSLIKENIVHNLNDMLPDVSIKDVKFKIRVTS